MKYLKLTLRDLFWLVLVVGMGCAWWIDRTNNSSTELWKSYWHANKDMTLRMKEVMRREAELGIKSNEMFLKQ